MAAILELRTVVDNGSEEQIAAAIDMFKAKAAAGDLEPRELADEVAKAEHMLTVLAYTNRLNRGEAALRQVLRGQQAEYDTLKKAGHIFPNVFRRLVAEVRGGEKKPQPIVSLNKAWTKACVAAGVPGRIPHDRS